MISHPKISVMEMHK